MDEMSVRLESLDVDIISASMFNTFKLKTLRILIQDAAKWLKKVLSIMSV